MNIYETEKDSQTQRTDLLLRGRGAGEGWSGNLGLADADSIQIG